RPFAFDVLQHVKAAAARQPDVEHDRVPFAQSNEIQGLLSGRCLSELAHVGGVDEGLLQSLPHDRVVVDDEDPQPRRHAITASRRGIFTQTLVPDPAAPEIDRPPPTSCARSRMPASPIDRGFDVSAEAIPIPSSRTSSRRSVPACSRVSMTHEARLWRATWASDSCTMRNIAVDTNGSRASVSRLARTAQ